MMGANLSLDHAEREPECTVERRVGLAKHCTNDAPTASACVCLRLPSNPPERLELTSSPGRA